MKVLVVYDIANDSLRNKIAEILKDFGLKRIQKSAFIGFLTSEERKDLERVLSRKSLEGNDRIDIFPICDRDLRFHSRIKHDGVYYGEKWE
ncbi:CRISPR-associated protein Cas2 [Ferroglobus placidus DSM 10642]|uniref:CRISPR-associated endoribonuclease Cas2 n=1 Tax=Ferroglobus placidus (strain DSM 10642 / AEDII12DO) TaxID=589924 RepID=D3RZS7_FERPA|nr:CRISPR-associated endonuclease Cas2 [Ferroglobus placidus]ADC65990.1 CRISPR-associated protein Cas2 [Ferroglobus placidus DSM 10642]